MATRVPAPVDTGVTPVVTGPVDRAPVPVPAGPGTTGQIPTARTPVGPPEAVPPAVTPSAGITVPPVATPQGPPETVPPAVPPGPGTGQSAGATVTPTVPVQELPVDTANVDAGTTIIPNINYIQVLANGTVVVARTTAMNFAGTGVTVTGSNGTATITVVGSSYGNSNVVTLLSSFGSNTVSTTGNVTAGYVFGNGSQLTGLPVQYSNANVATFLAAFGSNTISTTGNTSSGNLLTGGLISATGNITSGNILTGGIISSTGNITSGNINATNHTGTTVSVTGNVTGGNIISSTLNNSGNISVVASGNAWIFGSTGNLVLPRGGIVYETSIPGGVLSGNTIAFKPSSVIDADQQLLIYPTVIPGTDDNHLHLTTGNLYNTELFLGNDNLYVKLANTGNIVINSNDDTGNIAQWTFGTNGNLTLPANTFAVNYANGTAVSLGGNYGNANVATFLAAYGSNTVVTTGNINGGNLISSTTIYGNIDVILGNIANASAIRTRLVSNNEFSYIQTGNGTVSSTGNIVFSPYMSSAERVVINTASGNVSAVGNVTAQNFIGNISITGNVQGTTANVTLVAGSYSTVFDNTGVATFPGNVSVTGNVITPNLPAFRVYGNGVTSGLNTTTNTTGVLNGNNWAVDYNQGSYLNSTTGVFTAPVAGLYQVNLVARVANNVAPQAQAVVVKNDATTATNQVMWEVAANCTVNHFGVSTVSKLAVGDTLSLKITTGALTFDVNDNWSVAFLG